jgi:hypothetical protein
MNNRDEIEPAKGWRSEMAIVVVLQYQLRKKIKFKVSAVRI